MNSLLKALSVRFPLRCARTMAFLPLLLALPLAAGCGMTMKFGRMPDNTDRIAAFQVGTSTKADVLNALGPPKGGGRSQFPVEDRPRELWWYYYEESTLRDGQRIFVFIFFDAGRYDGHLWFSSLAQIQPSQK